MSKEFETLPFMIVIYLFIWIELLLEEYTYTGGFYILFPPLKNNILPVHPGKNCGKSGYLWLTMHKEQGLWDPSHPGVLRKV